MKTDSKSTKELRLKTCPFCGGTTLTIYSDFMIQCNNCDTIFAQPYPKKPKKHKSIVDIWNRRTKND